MRKYNTPEEQAAARREQNRLAQRRHRAKVKAEKAAKIAETAAPKVKTKEERKKELKRAANARYRARKKWLGSLSTQDKGLVTNLKNHGVTVQPDELLMWKDYISKRYAQQCENKYYEFDRWAEDFKKELKELRLSEKQLREDYAAFKADQLSLFEMMEETDFKE